MSSKLEAGAGGSVRGGRKRPLIERRAYPWLATGLAGSALLVALLAQYAGGLAPCALCHWQRYGYAAAAAAGLCAILSSAAERRRRFFLALMALICLATAALGLYHLGLERGWWAGSAACAGADLSGLSGEALREAILTAPLVRCDRPAFTLFGLSMAGYSALYALGLAALAFRGARA